MWRIPERNSELSRCLVIWGIPLRNFSSKGIWELPKCLGIWGTPLESLPRKGILQQKERKKKDIYFWNHLRVVLNICF